MNENSEVFSRRRNMFVKMESENAIFESLHVAPKHRVSVARQLFTLHAFIFETSKKENDLLKINYVHACIAYC